MCQSFSNTVYYVLTEIVFHNCACYQCYSCVGTPPQLMHIPSVIPNLKVTPACSDPVRTNELDHVIVQCNKTLSCMKIDIGVGPCSYDDKVVIRGCHEPRTCKSFTDCSVCTDDLCNSSPSLHPYGVLTAILIGLIYF